MAERGHLQVFLGYAAGVGKTYKMLDAARRARERGADIVIGYFEPHGRAETIALTEGLEAVPRRAMEYRGGRFEEMDCEAILARRPAICVVDELPHTNVGGSARTKRWEDVQAMLERGIDVYTTLNVQHLESLNDQVFRISGVRVRETVPDWVVGQADEVVLVDVTPRALIHRLERGVVYGREKAERALANFFKEETLAALRELAMRQTAHVVEGAAGAWAETEGERGLADPASPRGLRRVVRPLRADQRILAHVTADPSSAMVIRRAKRVADYNQAECYAVHVQRAGEGESAAVGRHLDFARNLHLETRLVTGADEAQALAEFARQHRIRQIFTGRPAEGGQRQWAGLVNRLVRLANDMEVTIVAGRRG